MAVAITLLSYTLYYQTKESSKKWYHAAILGASIYYAVWFDLHIIGILK